MAPEKTTKRKAPSAVADFTVLPLTLPTLSGLPASYEGTQHYLYIKPHEPSAYTATAERSLFVANVPTDASESNIRALFAEQLGGARVESVDFDASVPARPLHKRWKQEKRGDDESEEQQRGKKRKRNDAEIVAEGVVEDEDSALPALWASEARRSGSAAVVVFVDKRSARGALKEIQAAVKSGRAVQWKAGSGLGVERKSHHLSRQIKVKADQDTSILILYRLQIPPRPPPPLRLRPAIQHKRLPHPIQHPRNPTRQAAQARAHRPRRRRLHHRGARRARGPRAHRGSREEEGGARGAEEEQRRQGRLLPLPEPREEEGGRDQPAQAV